MAIPFATVDGATAACLPCAIKREKFLFAGGDSSLWGHVNGPVFAEELDQSQQAEAARQLLAQLPRWLNFTLICDPAPDNSSIVEAFKAAGFSHTTQVTYQEHPTDPDVMDLNNKNGLDKKRRSNIRRVEKRLNFTENVGAHEFMDFYLDNLSAAGDTCYADPAIPLKIMQSGLCRSLAGRSIINGDGVQTAAKRVVIFAAKEKSEVEEAAPLVAATACVFDARRCYYWMTTRRRSDDSNDAVKALVLRARNRARQLGLIFDADGVISDGSEELFKLTKLPRRVYRDIFTRRALHDYRPEIKTCISLFKNSLSAFLPNGPRWSDLPASSGLRNPDLSR